MFLPPICMPFGCLVGVGGPSPVVVLLLFMPLAFIWLGEEGGDEADMLVPHGEV
jgi:hypothetical protein